jgi:alkanesulfonate monooxygenase SsuD/methylene tetrahydromethanopterin reductase-like flavin-dependent oxidoreductase (luciferase family)
LENLEPRPKLFDPLISLSFIAAETQKVKIGTSLLVLPYLEPVNTALQISALDHFSSGRLIVGVGSGAYREEFEALHPNISSSNRGKYMDEGIESLLKLMSEDKTSFNGEFIQFKNIEMNLKPLQSPLPLWIGGNAKIVQRRVALHGEGWFPAALSAHEIRLGVNRIKKIAEKIGRNPRGIEIAPQYLGFIDETSEGALNKYKKSLGFTHTKSLKESTLKQTAEMMMQDDSALIERNFIGSPDEIIEQIEQFSDAGATYFPALAFSHESNKLESVVDQWKLFSKEVMPSF